MFSTAYEAGELTPVQVESLIESQSQALECISLNEIHVFRHLAFQLVKSDFSVGEQEFIDEKSVSAALQELREFISKLTNAQKHLTLRSSGTAEPAWRGFLHRPSARSPLPSTLALGALFHCRICQCFVVVKIAAYGRSEFNHPLPAT